MGASYYKTPNEEGIFEDSISMALHIAEAVEGKIYARDPYFSNLDLLVHYNTNTGVVVAQSLWANVNNIFAPSISASLIAPVASAIALIAQRDLLLWLHEQQDPIISAVIQHSGLLDKKGFVNYSAIENTYIKILYTIGSQANNKTPLQHAVLEALPKHPDAIRAGSDVESLKLAITEKQATYSQKFTR